MKSTILLILFGLMLIVSTPVLSQVSTTPPVSQEQVTLPTPVLAPSFIEKIWNSVKDSGIWVLITFVCGILSKNGVTTIVKAVAGKTTIITKELSDVSLSVSNFSGLIDKAIKADGTVDQNSLKEAAEAGKTVIAETKEAWITIKPKPVGVPAV